MICLAPALVAAFTTALCSTVVIPAGTLITTSGFKNLDLPNALFKKYLSKASVTLLSAITPFLRGLLATILSGVLPIIFLASDPTAITLNVLTSIATTVGSTKEIPSPCTKTIELAVPKSIPIFLPNMTRLYQLYGNWDMIY